MTTPVTDTEFSLAHWLSQEIRDRIEIEWDGERFTGTVNIGKKTYTLSVDRNSLPEVFDNVPLAYAGADITAAIRAGNTFCSINEEDKDNNEILITFLADDSN